MSNLKFIDFINPIKDFWKSNPFVSNKLYCGEDENTEGNQWGNTNLLWGVFQWGNTKHQQEKKIWTYWMKLYQIKEKAKRLYLAVMLLSMVKWILALLQ